MQNTVLVDTGVIVALLNMRDTQHQAITDLFIERDAGRGTPLVTTWPVITEACSFLPDNRQGQVLDWLSDSGIGIVSIDERLAFMRAQMARYDNLPCDFADASLLYAASVTGVREIWTLDRDFSSPLGTMNQPFSIDIGVFAHPSRQVVRRSLAGSQLSNRVFGINIYGHTIAP